MLPFEIDGELTFHRVAEGLVDDIGFMVLGVPEVVAVDIAVGEPEGTMMGVVGLFSRDVLFHGEVPGETGAGGADEGVEVGEVVIGAVFSDEGVAVEELE